MPRPARTVIPNAAHHVTQRGKNSQYVFFVDDDRRAYLRLLREHTERFSLKVLAYCLMGHHVHPVAIPRRPETLAQAVGRTHFRFTQYIDRLHGRSGRPWQGRFYSAALDELHLWAALHYVERNPMLPQGLRRIDEVAQR